MEKEKIKKELETLVFEKLTTEREGIPQYKAGLPGYNRVFARDSIISCLLMQDDLGMEFILKKCINRQGEKQDPLTGEERGKIFHECPGVEIRGKLTDFNASDTTALFLIGMNYHNKRRKDNFVRINSEAIEKAVNYILNHIKNDFFVESPKFCGADKFALKVTYWKDSEIFDRPNGEPVYPVAYSLLQTQVIAGLRSAAELTGRKELNKIASRLNKALWDKLYDKKLGILAIGKDKQGLISGITSDALHALYYLNGDDVPKDGLEEIVEKSRDLETPVGYRTAYSSNGGEYHFGSIWPFEQAFIHAGGKKFGLEHVKEVASRVVDAVGSDNHEYLLYHERTGKTEKKGCNPQLWTVAAKSYFLGEKS